MTQFAALRPKKYNYLTDDNDKNKKEKVTKKCVFKGKHKFEDYEGCLKAINLTIR